MRKPLVVVSVVVIVLDANALVRVDKNWRRENLRAVVFAQERGSRRVLAAGTLKLF